ncbi:MAG: type II secretion system protein [bacterium]
MSLFNKSKKILLNQRGSGMIGLLAVVVIIGIVFWYMSGGNGGSIAPSSPSNVKESIEKGEEAGRDMELKTLEQAIRLYQSEHGQYPDNLQTLAEEGYVANSALTDPDGETYDYKPSTGEVSKPQ